MHDCSFDCEYMTNLPFPFLFFNYEKKNQPIELLFVVNDCSKKNNVDIVDGYLKLRTSTCFSMLFAGARQQI